MDLLCFTKFFHFENMMYLAIVNDKNASGAWVWIHLAHKALQILQELLPIIAMIAGNKEYL
jgi:lipopolysaccharide export LptBFGC system permease protein LptF